MSSAPSVPSIRVATRNAAPTNADGAYVLYWTTSARRTRRNFALDRAVELARRHDRPVVVLEALRCGHRWASDRLHRFVMDGMRENARRLDAAGVARHTYVEPSPGAGRGLLAALAARAVVVVGDEFPSYFLPRMTEAAARALPVRFETVDSAGLSPMRAAPRAFPTAHAFRRHLQKSLLPHLRDQPLADPLASLRGMPRAAIPADVLRRWPRASDDLLAGRAPLASLPIDHDVPPAPLVGGAVEGSRRLRAFVDRALGRYDEDRNHPDRDATSGLSPYLHFGHVGAHEAFARIADAEGWTPPSSPPRATGSRVGFWGMSAAAEAFLDQIVTWRELCLNNAFHREDHDDLAGIPGWARAALDARRGDARGHVYSTEEFEAAATHDPVWNAAQRQLRDEGRLHNYLRMLWGKKVLEWSRTPEDAFATLVRLNDRWAVDGRDPNSYGGILWCFGKFDRPWGPARPIFGSVRYMSSESAVRKLRMKQYLARHGAGAASVRAGRRRVRTSTAT